MTLVSQHDIIESSTCHRRRTVSTEGQASTYFVWYDNKFPFPFSKSIFQDMVSVDVVISKILNFAQTLVDADGTSLFLVDTVTNELYAKVFR